MFVTWGTLFYSSKFDTNGGVRFGLAMSIMCYRIEQSNITETKQNRAPGFGLHLTTPQVLYDEKGQ